MRTLICSFLLLPLIVPGQAPPGLRSTTTEVMFDLVVRDKKNKIVRDLKPEEIQVLEDGVPQTVRHFEFVEGRASEGSAPAVEGAVQPAARTTASTPAPQSTVNQLRDAGLVTVIVAPGPPDTRKDTLDALLHFIGDEVRPGVYVGVYYAWGEHIFPLQPYTDDPDRLAAAAKRAVIAAGSIHDTSVDFAGDQQPGTSGAAAADINRLVQTDMAAESADEYQGSVEMLLGVRRLIMAQRVLRGRKVVLLFSPGLLVHPLTKYLLDSAISVANRSDVTVYGIDTLPLRYDDDELGRSNRLLTTAANSIMAQQLDPSHVVTASDAVNLETAERSIYANVRGELRVLAGSTGGKVLWVGSDLREPLRTAMEDLRTHYELTYAPMNPVTDGTFRKIEVKVARPNVTVFARSGYYALPLINGREIYPFEMATLGALNATPLPHQFDFHAAALRFRPGPEKMRYAFVFQAPVRGLTVTKEKQWATVHVSVTALVKDPEGHVVDKISRDIPYQMPADQPAELQRAAVSFTAPLTLPPGRYTVETAAVDRESKNQKASVRRSVLMVAPAASGLAASDVTLVRRVSAVHGPPNPSDPLQARGAQVLPELSSTVAFAPGDKMSFYAVAYPPAPAQGPVKMSVVLTRDGQPVLDSEGTTVQLEPNGVASALASLPAAKVPPGNYEARITFTYGEQSTTSETEVTVEAAEGSPAAK